MQGEHYYLLNEMYNQIQAIYRCKGQTGPYARVRIKVSEYQPSSTLVVKFCLSKFYSSLIWKASFPLSQTQLYSTAGAECLLLSTLEVVPALLVWTYRNIHVPALTHEHTAYEVLKAYSYLFGISALWTLCMHMSMHILLNIYLSTGSSIHITHV